MLTNIILVSLGACMGGIAITMFGESYFESDDTVELENLCDDCEYCQIDKREILEPTNDDKIEIEEI